MYDLPCPVAVHLEHAPCTSFGTCTTENTYSRPPLAEADDFAQEVETLRRSQAFQRFLDERSRSTRRIPLEELEAEIEQELAAEGKPA